MTRHDPRIDGVCPILAVPFDTDGELDLDGFGAVVDHVLATGVTALTLFGLASEFYKLTDAEQDELVDALLARTADEPAVCAIVSVTDHATEVAVRRARALQARGVDAINLLPPHFLGPPPAQVVAHVDAVLGAVDVPVILQHAPAQTGSSLDPHGLADLARRHDNLGYVKAEALPPGPYVTILRDASEGLLRPLIGYAGMHLVDGLRRGVVGVQPGCSLVEVYREIVRRHRAGEVEAAEDLHARLLPFLAMWMSDIETIIAAEKLVLERRGVIVDARCRMPGRVLDDRERRDVDDALARFADLLVR